jgi:poly-beta-1,6-N-acetyl-D-glucosamine synthase
MMTTRLSSVETHVDKSAAPIPSGMGTARFGAASYVVISPVRNEAEHLDEVIAAVVAQTVPPAEWVLVNDGSTDATAAIAERWAARFSWIRVVHRTDRGGRSQGTGVMEAFYDGFNTLRTVDWQYLVKLDGDIVVSPTYFERCFAEFVADPKLGIGGGTVDHLDNGHARTEGHPRFHVRGATKIYRRPCWEGLGGLIKSPGWDTVDELKAHFLGWDTRTFPDLRVMHRRITGAADGAWRNAVKNGTANYVSAYHPLFMLVKCLKRLASKPYGLQALGLWYGFMRGYVRSLPRVDERALIRYIRQQQLRRLFFRKSIWD